MLSPLLALVVAAAHPDPVAARVGSEVIRVGEVAQRVEQSHVTPGAALDQLIKEALLAAAARAEGTWKRPEIRARVATERRRLAVERLLQVEVLARVAVTDAEVADAFHARVDRVRLSMVVRATGQEASATLERLRAGAALIEEARSSMDPAGRAKSGVLGWFSRNELAPALAQEAFSVPLLEPTGPVPLEKGFAVFVVHERSVGTAEALQRSGPEIRRTLLAAKRDARATRFVRELRRASGHPASDADLIAREAARRGLERDPQVVRAIHGLERSLLARTYVDQLAKGVETPTREELESAYYAHADRFWVPQRRSCDLLLARTEQQAEQLRSRLIAGEAFDTVAKDSADMGTGEPTGKGVAVTDPELDAMSSSGSDQHALAWTIRKTPPGIWAKADANGHWHVIRCGPPEPAHQRPLSEARADLARSLRDQRLSAEIEERVAQLRRVTPVRIASPPIAAGEKR